MTKPTSNLFAVAAIIALLCAACVEEPYMDEDGHAELPTEELHTIEQATFTSTHMEMCVKTDDTANAGTSANVVLSYANIGTGYWECTIEGGINKGEERCCVSAKLPDYAETTINQVDGTFSVKVEGNNGLKFTRVARQFYLGNGFKVINSFKPVTTGLDGDRPDCVGSTSGDKKKHCWADKSGHNGCERVEIKWSNQKAYCYK